MCRFSTLVQGALLAPILRSPQLAASQRPERGTRTMSGLSPVSAAIVCTRAIVPDPAFHGLLEGEGG